MSWVLGIVGVILLSVLVDIILPNGQMNKYIKGIFALLFIFMLISPITGFLKKDVSFDFANFNVSGYQEDSAFLHSINTDRLNNSKSLIINALEQNAIYDANIVIFSATNNINLIDYAVVELRHEADEEQLDLITSIVRRQLGISKDKINIYTYV